MIRVSSFACMSRGEEEAKSGKKSHKLAELQNLLPMPSGRKDAVYKP